MGLLRSNAHLLDPVATEEVPWVHAHLVDAYALLAVAVLAAAAAVGALVIAAYRTCCCRRGASTMTEKTKAH